MPKDCTTAYHQQALFWADRKSENETKLSDDEKKTIPAKKVMEKHEGKKEWPQDC
jgi:hypothetical protein